MIPRMGKLIANDAESYQYLVESIRKFPRQQTFADMVSNAGFKNVSWTDYSGGVAALHQGWKI
jgi:demethylmenaquinone methyltransferase/2-methoxy-6-polyprenyl-1,4-benzoquinol methylase